jgi:hypothetical protein
VPRNNLHVSSSLIFGCHLLAAVSSRRLFVVEKSGAYFVPLLPAERCRKLPEAARHQDASRVSVAPNAVGLPSEHGRIPACFGKSAQQSLFTFGTLCRDNTRSFFCTVCHPTSATTPHSFVYLGVVFCPRIAADSAAEALSLFFFPFLHGPGSFVARLQTLSSDP